MWKKLKRKLKDVEWKKIAIHFIIITTIMTAGSIYMVKNKPEEISYNEFLTMVEDKKVDKIDLMGNNEEIIVISNDKKYKTSNPKSLTFKERMLKKDIEVINKTPNSVKLTVLVRGLFNIAFIALIAFVLWSLVKNTVSKKDSIVKEKPNVNFNDIAGNLEAKEDMKFLVNFLKEPKKYEKMGAKLPKGVVLYGPPGTGKTMMAKAVAGEAGVPFYSATGSDFVEMYVGLGAKRVRDLFKQAKENSPSIVFIDEIDAVGTSRGKENSNSEKDQTINALLAELDGFDSDSQVIVMAATNRVEDLDEALIRPGRFDRHVNIGLPDYEGRLAILNRYAIDKNLADGVNLESLANITIGFSGASLEALMNEASIIAVNKGKNEIDLEDIDDSYYKIAMKGNKKINKNEDKDEIELVAYHEAGHALVTKLLTDNHLHKVTIIPSTSGAGGATFSVPKTNSLISKKQLLNNVKVLYAGRAAEEILKGRTEDITSGASSDIQQATKYIKAYFSELGMSSQFGMLAIEDDSLYMEDAVKLSKKLYEETLDILRDNHSSLVLLANELIKHETLTGDEVNSLLDKEE